MPIWQVGEKQHSRSVSIAPWSLALSLFRGSGNREPLTKDNGTNYFCKQTSVHAEEYIDVWKIQAPINCNNTA